MAYVRGQAAYAEETLRGYLVDQLTTLGWYSSPSLLPYGATQPVTLIDYLPAQSVKLVNNTIAMTNGDEGDDVEAELGAGGGGLHTTQRVYFIDIFGESQGMALRIADDVKAVLTGKLPGTSRYLPVQDLVNGGVLAGHLLHFEDVVRTKPTNNDYQRFWQVVKLTMIHEFNAAENYLTGAP